MTEIAPETPNQMRTRHAMEWSAMMARLMARRPTGRMVEARAIIAAHAHRAGYTLEEFTGPGRRQPLVAKRQDCMAEVKRFTDLSYPVIAQLFHRDHTTVLHGIRASNERAGI